MKRKYKLILILLAGIILRAGYLITPGINSDQAIFALEGIHILKGDFTIFQWSYAYMGTIQSYLDAIAFYLFDPSRLVINVIPVLISIFFILTTYLAGREILGEEGGILSGIFAAVSPAYLSIYGGVARYGYMETLLFGSLLLLITLRLSRTEDPKNRGRLLILLGFIAGLGLWTNFLIIVYFPALGLYLLFKDKMIFRKKTLIALPFFLVGSLPVWIYNLKHSFASLEILETGEKVSFLKNFEDAILIGMPEMLGMNVLQGTITNAFSYIVFIIYFFSIILLIITGLKDLTTRRFNGTGLILIFFLSLLIIFSASGFGGYIKNTRRYLLPLYSGIPILIPIFLIKVRNYSRHLMTGIAGFILLVNLYSNLKGYDFMDRESFNSYKEEMRVEKELFNFMKDKGIFHSYVIDYWLGPMLTFDSGEEVIFAQSFGDRSPDYIKRVDEAQNFSYLIGEQASRDFEKDLNQMKAEYKKRAFGKYDLFYSIKPPSIGFKPISTERWYASASEDMRDVKSAYDRDMTTRAMSVEPRTAGMFYMIDMGKVHRVNKISLISGLPHNSPKGCRVELSRDGIIWEDMTGDNDFLGVYWENGRPKVDGSGRLIFIFKPIPVRFVKIILTESDSIYDWSLTEIFIYEDSDRTQDPQSLIQHFNKGRFFEEKGRFAEAVKEYREVLKIEPGYEEAYHAIGRIYNDLEVLNRYYNVRGLIFEHAALWQEAIDSYKKFIEELGDNSIGSIYSHLGNCYERIGDKGKAEEMNEAFLKEFMPGNPVHINYGGKIIFLGYDLNKRQAKRGETFNIKYYWEGLKLMDKDYIIFVHFKNKDSMFQHDHRPLEGRYYRETYRTNEWPEGEKIREGYEISVPWDIEPGIYTITIGIVDPKEGKRLRVKGKNKSEAVEIGKIEIL